MSRPQNPQPVKLIVSLLTAKHDLADQVCEKLKIEFGPLDFMSAPLPFNFTDYYEEEIGRDLFRHLLSFEKLIAPDVLPSIKLYTNQIEQGFVREDGTRMINVDPGYMALCHLILATCKRFSHRPYLRDGVYADMTLIFKGKRFRPLEWTFPDYSSDELMGLLNKIRGVYYRQLQDQQSV